MWRNLFRPEVLFMTATLQALVPYLLWTNGFGVANAQQDIRLNYMPVVIWAVGYAAFLVGCRLVGGEMASNPLYVLQSCQDRLRWLLFVVILLVVAELAWLTKVYGTLPILSYIRQDHQLDITKAVRMQEDSAVGQIGILHLTLFLLNAIVLIQFIINLETGKKAWALLVIAFGVMLAGNLSNGKRQGLFRALVFLCCGLAIYSNGLIGALGRALPIPRNRLVGGVAMGVIIVAFVGLTGYIASARNQGRFQRDTWTEIIAYQEFPLINMEAQCQQAGFGPSRFDLLYSFQRWIPYKLITASGIASMPHPERPIPSSPAGLYEDIQWSMGLWGVAGFSLALGAILQWLYRNSLHRLICLLIYSQCAFALLIAHSFNEFLILTYDPAPFVCFGILVWMLRIPRNVDRTQQIPVPRGELAAFPSGLSWH